MSLLFRKKIIFFFILTLFFGFSCDSQKKQKELPRLTSAPQFSSGGIPEELKAKKAEIEKWKEKLTAIPLLISKNSRSENYMENLAQPLNLPDPSLWKKWFESGANIEFINFDDFPELTGQPRLGKKQSSLSFFDRGPVNQVLRAYADVSDWEKGTVRPNAFKPQKAVYKKLNQVQYLLVVKVEEFSPPKVIDTKSYYSGRLKMEAFLIDCTEEPQLKGHTRISVVNEKSIEFMPYNQASSQQVSFQANIILLAQFEEKSRAQLISNLKEFLGKK